MLSSTLLLSSPRRRVAVAIAPMPRCTCTTSPSPPGPVSPPPSSLRRRVRTRQCLGTNDRRAICEAIGSVHRDVMSIATWECIWVWIGLTMKSAETSQLIKKKHSAEPSPCEFGSRGDPAGVTGARRSDSGVFESQYNRERTSARAGDEEREGTTRGDERRCPSSHELQKTHT
ncbi:hypothetical protein EDB84DRAFT_1628473 [Lactarius hengduanensis]|nr:hypothetical protein EDB84DRAFT_1628473 [Lactarius hengduanensis]